MEKYKECGGILGLDREFQSDTDDTTSESSAGLDTPTMMAPFSDFRQGKDTDNTPPLPAKPPGKPLFINQPSLFSELYPPFAKQSPTGSVFDAVEATLLNEDEPKALEQVITSRWLRLCYKRKPCPLSVWQWLFQVMSRSDKPSLVKAAYSTLLDLVTIAETQGTILSVYCPSHAELMDTLVNLGMDKEYLSNDGMSVSDEVFSPAQLPVSNLSHFLKFLKVCVQVPSRYTVQELQLLIVLMVRISLDPYCCQALVSQDVASCFNSLVSAVPAPDWTCLVEPLTDQLAKVSPHHHNKLYVVRLITGVTERLFDLQINTCRKSIELLLERELPGCQSAPDRIFVTNILKYYLRQRFSSYSYEEYYRMHSVLTLVSLFLNNSTGSLVWPDSTSEREFARMLGDLSDKVNDHSEHSERGVVKDLAIHMKVDFEVRKTRKRQKSIDDFLS